MSLQEIKYREAKPVSLTDDDLSVLRTIYHLRLRVFFFALTPFVLWALSYSGKWLQAYDRIGNDNQFILGSITGIMLFLIIPWSIVFLKCIWVYKKDMSACIKYEVQEVIVGKKYFPYTNQYFLSLADASYMHHEVDQTTYESLEVGGTYPVYFAAYSRYPFTLRSRITMM